MNKRELTEAFAKEIGLTLRDAEVCINTLFNSIADTLSKGGRVEIRGFGSFKVKEYEPYSGRNPKTGESIQIRSKKLPYFKLSSMMQKRINKKPIE
ncbi:MAG: integration host factor subunit beta [Deltaproteobacteria bacterium]|jgi:integration host factor subunit beta|nr:integration host factor subunit beta [Deltaproteobacteria bacterium]MDH3899067.1 integration host factor subunit beta [Deltaproteobacteria bacterium]